MMTLEEAIERIEQLKRNCQNLAICSPNGKSWALQAMALSMALSALRPVSREQVEKAWTAEWTVDEFGHKCSKCGEYLPDGEDVRKPQFCPECGRAMTDEAVDIIMRRLETLYETT